MSGLRAESARNLAAAEEAWQAAKHALAEAEREREKWRARCRPLLPENQLVVIGGVEITVTPSSSGRTFRLAGFLDAGHKITREMRPFVGVPTSYDRWTVRRERPA